MTDREQFTTIVEPIMDRVMKDLRSRQAEEAKRFMRSPAYILSGGVGPDGGMGVQAVALDTLKVTGEWNSKTVEDYVEMVRKELRGKDITVTPELEEMMLDKMARDEMPKSSIDYILRNFSNFKKEHLSQPRAKFLRRDGGRQIYELRVVDRSQGRPSRLTFHFSYDERTRKWERVRQ